jgi:Flp pilus assembly protein TadD
MSTNCVPVLAVLLSALAGSALSGCSGVSAPPPTPAEAALRAGVLPDSVPPVPPGGEIDVAKQHFRDGNFGYAARYYQRAVAGERAGAEGWLGLAAAYDRLGRFGLADRAYAEAAALAGSSAVYHNNIGFSYMLRGEREKARRSLLRALSLDPRSVTVRNNLELLDRSAHISERRGEALSRAA